MTLDPAPRTAVWRRLRERLQFVAARITAVVVLFAVAAAIVGGVAISALAHLRDNSEKVSAGVVAVGHLADVREANAESRAASLTLALATTGAQWQGEMQAFDSEVDDGFAAFVATGDADAGDQASFAAALASYRAHRATALDLSLNQIGNKGNALRDATAKDVAAMTEALDKLTTESTDLAESRAKESARAYQSGRFTVILALLLATGLALAAGWYVARSIGRPLSRFVTVLDRVGAGDLTARPDVSAGGEIGAMGESLARTLGRLREAFSEVVGASSVLTEAAASLNDLAENLATSADTASGEANRVAAAIEEVSRNVDAVASTSEQSISGLREIGGSAAALAGDGERASDLSRKTVTAMSNLSSSSERVSAVVALIAHIAHQSHLLALNATIEAAHAGAAGRGFAVVANEVNALSETTALSAAEIAGLITQMRADAEAVTGEVEAVGRIIETIREHQFIVASSVEEQTTAGASVAQNMAFVALAAREIAGGVTTVADAARMTAEGTAQARTSAREVRETADRLRETVSGLKI